MKLHRREAIKLLGASAAAAATVGFVRRARAAETISIATLAPASSPWGKVFKVWEEAVKKKSDGKLELQFFYNGQQGDEDAAVGKMKSGQLDGAAVTAVGLSKVYKPILALQMPGVFSSWDKLDKARDGLKGDFEKGAKDAGFTILGWGDVGAVRTFSKGFAVKVPDDLKGKKPFYGRADSILPAVYGAISGVSGVPLNVPEVLPNLNTGAINVVIAPALAAEQLQWSSKLDNLNDAISGFAIGALIVQSKRLESLSEDLRTILLDTGKVAAQALTKKIREEDDASFTRLKGKMTVTTPSSDDKSKWDAIFKSARQKLAQGTFTSDLVTKIEGYGK